MVNYICDNLFALWCQWNKNVSNIYYWNTSICDRRLIFGNPTYILLNGYVWQKFFLHKLSYTWVTFMINQLWKSVHFLVIIVNSELFHILRDGVILAASIFEFCQTVIPRDSSSCVLELIEHANCFARSHSTWLYFHI